MSQEIWLNKFLKFKIHDGIPMTCGLSYFFYFFCLKMLLNSSIQAGSNLVTEGREHTKKNLISLMTFGQTSKGSGMNVERQFIYACFSDANWHFWNSIFSNTCNCVQKWTIYLSGMGTVSFLFLEGHHQNLLWPNQQSECATVQLSLAPHLYLQSDEMTGPVCALKTFLNKHTNTLTCKQWSPAGKFALPVFVQNTYTLVVCLRSSVSLIRP